MTETHDPAGPGPRDEIRDTEAYRLGRAVALLRALLDDDRDTDRAMAREFLDEEEERARAAKERFEEWKRTRRPDGPRADAPVEVVVECKGEDQ